MKKITTRSIFASIFVFCLVSAQAQLDIQSIEQAHRKSLRFGVDVFSVVNAAMNPEEKMINFHSDFHFKPDIYFAAEGGFQDFFRKEDKLDYYSDGFYLSLGADKNLLKGETPNDLNIVFIGLRYGIAIYQHSADSITTNNYWDDSYKSIESAKLNTHWVEFVIGMKSELFFARNFFVGWTLRYRTKVIAEKDDQMAAYQIPGFGKGEKNSNMGFNFSLYFRIPFKK